MLLRYHSSHVCLSQVIYVFRVIYVIFFKSFMLFESCMSFRSHLLHPLTTNEHTINDKFDAKSRIESIDPAHFQQGFKYVSFDVE
jgi:hypothetical protein